MPSLTLRVVRAPRKERPGTRDGVARGFSLRVGSLYDLAKRTHRCLGNQGKKIRCGRFLRLPSGSTADSPERTQSHASARNEPTARCNGVRSGTPSHASARNEPTAFWGIRGKKSGAGGFSASRAGPQPTRPNEPNLMRRRETNPRQDVTA